MTQTMLATRYLAVAAITWALASVACSDPDTAAEHRAVDLQPTVSSVPGPGAAPLPDSTGAWVLPGRLRRDMSVNDLRALFGAESVARMAVHGAEGATADAIVLFDTQPDKRLELLEDQEGATGIASAHAFGAGSRWRLANGVRLGMTLDELVQLNGAPVRFVGLDWDYGGAISDWNGGRLAPASDIAPFFGVRLGHAADLGSDEPPYAMGDAEFRSDDAAFPKQGRLLYVEEISVELR